MYCKKLYNFLFKTKIEKDVKDVKEVKEDFTFEKKIKELEEKNIILENRINKLNTNIVKHLKCDLELEEYINVDKNVDQEEGKIEEW